MEEEKKVVTDEELEKALLDSEEEELEEEKKEEEKEEKKPEEELEPSDNKERTKLGREVKSLKEQLSLVTEQLNLLLKVKEEKPEVSFYDEENEEEEKLTKKQLEKILPELLSKKAKQDIDKKKQYESTYLATISVLGDDLEDGEKDEVTKLMIDKHNEMITGDPKIDASLNFARAEKDWWKNKKPAVKKVTKGENPPEHDDNDNKAVVHLNDVLGKLDKDAREFAEQMKLTPEQIKKALKLK